MIEASRNVIGLADSTEADQWVRLTALETNPAWDSGQAAAARDKHRILKGSLLWRLDRDYRYRLWKQKRAVAGIERSLAETGDLESRAQSVRSGMPLRLDDYGAQILLLKPRIEALQAQIDSVLMSQQKQLETVVADELEVRRQRLASYRVQARFALATIYDQSAVVSLDNGEAVR
jgi:hypothetical protein